MAFYQGKKDFGSKFIEPPTTWTTEITKVGRAGDILMSVRAPVGPVNFATEEVCIGRGLAAIRSRKELDRDFLFYQLLHSQPEIAGKEGAVFASINKSEIAALPIAFAPMAEQQRIVGVIDEAFAGLATAQANAEKNLQNARALFESSLESAITGELTRAWRRDQATNDNAATNLTRIAERRSPSTWAGKLKEPAAPVTRKPVAIPESWVLASPEQITTHIVDCPHSTPKWSKSGVLCMRTTNFNPGFLDLASVQFVSEETYQERILRLEPKPGDVLYSREGGILGIACIIPDKLKTCMGQRMMLFRLETELAMPKYFAAVLNSTLILSEVKRLTSGAASPHLNIRDIRTFPIPLPPISEQRQIVSKLDALAGETQRLESLYLQKQAALAELKKSLLHQAFTGNL